MYTTLTYHFSYTHICCIGGYRPVSMRQLMLPYYETFLSLFTHTFQATLSHTQNEEFLHIVSTIFHKEQWSRLIQAYKKAISSAINKLTTQQQQIEYNKTTNNIDYKSNTNSTTTTPTASSIATTTPTNKNNNKNSSSNANNYNTNIHIHTHSIIQDVKSKWDEFSSRINTLETNLQRIENGFAFANIDGLLIQAMKSGHWLLLDEINLATSETLQYLANILDNQNIIYTLSNGHNSEGVIRHPDFRIFAAMNPPTDVSKRELPLSLRARFTEIYTPELLDPQDLECIVSKYMIDIPTTPISDIVQVYLGCRSVSDFSQNERSNSSISIADGAGQKPHYSLRSLTRSLKAAKSFISIGILLYYIYYYNSNNY